MPPQGCSLCKKHQKLFYWAPSDWFPITRLGHTLFVRAFFVLSASQTSFVPLQRWIFSHTWEKRLRGSVFRWTLCLYILGWVLVLVRCRVHFISIILAWWECSPVQTANARVSAETDFCVNGFSFSTWVLVVLTVQEERASSSRQASGKIFFVLFNRFGLFWTRISEKASDVLWRGFKLQNFGTCCDFVRIQRHVFISVSLEVSFRH